jgi:hypothetical protein
MTCAVFIQADRFYVPCQELDAVEGGELRKLLLQPLTTVDQKVREQVE